MNSKTKTKTNDDPFPLIASRAIQCSLMYKRKISLYNVVTHLLAYLR